MAPSIIIALMAPFRSFFTAPVWDHVLALVTGMTLAPGKRTVSAALRVIGLGQARDFARYHHVLSRARWNSAAIGRKLLLMILDRFFPAGRVVIGIDDTIERRWGHKIAARGIYRDPVRSSHGHFVKTSGLRWLAVMAMVPVPWTRRHWALPFLTILAPSERYAAAHRRRHKKLTDWARQAILQVRRWAPKRSIVVVADFSFSALDLIAAVRRHVCFVTRLRLDANLFAPAPPRRPGQLGRPPKKGCPLPKLCQALGNKATRWTKLSMPYWYGDQRCILEFTTGTAVWYHPGLPPAPDPLGAHARSNRRAGSAGVPLHRHRRHASRNSRLVRPPLVHRDDVPGIPRPSGRRNRAAMVRSRHRANDAGVARLVLARDALGGQSHSPRQPSPQIGRSAWRSGAEHHRLDGSSCHRPGPDNWARSNRRGRGGFGLTPHTSVGAIIAGLDWTVASTALSLSILLAFAESVRVPSKSSTRNSPREGRTRSW